jgi:hypothetical protein
VLDSRDDRFDEILANLEHERLLVDRDLRRLAAAATYLGKQLSKLTTKRCPVRHLKQGSEKTKNCHRRSASSSKRRRWR